ncbi:hypothetical protein TIFTF001_032873 [Ficus carica]|uniref:Uncharacterized protein n=1 Tax=Ficus carica TaxID=3494 RepID=A0AA88J6Z9_FICCA|nr:hypothetical protein TIFTF001_032873 [Ficus carica]
MQSTLDTVTAHERKEKGALQSPFHTSDLHQLSPLREYASPQTDELGMAGLRSPLTMLAGSNASRFTKLYLSSV